MLTRADILMGRDAKYPLSPELEVNLTKLLLAVNKLLVYWGKPVLVNSGYRPGEFNTRAGGAPNSPHLTCEAVDLYDFHQVLGSWLVKNVNLLEECGLYMESGTHTPTWVHLQIRPTKSGKRIFIPN